MNDAEFYGFLAVQMALTFGVVCFVILWRGPWDSARYAGFALLVTGIIFFFTARFQLGKSFSVTAQARQLVTHGLYSKIRNPIYVFSSMMVLGVLLVVQKPLLFVFLAVLIVIQTWRAHKEAQVLEDKFGDEYRQYRRHTWF
jgi:protein-S-isoprenylcysteine O-methyltransferase Ste14